MQFLAGINIEGLALANDGNDIPQEEKYINILEKVIEDLKQGYNCGKIYDSKGRVVGEWRI